MQKYRLKLKGTGPISHHLGCNFERDSNRVLCMCPRQYIEKLVDGYERLFGEKPSMKYRSPQVGGDHPELDDSNLLDNKEIRIYLP